MSLIGQEPRLTPLVWNPHGPVGDAPSQQDSARTWHHRSRSVSSYVGYHERFRQRVSALSCEQQDSLILLFKVREEISREIESATGIDCEHVEVLPDHLLVDEQPTAIVSERQRRDADPAACFRVSTLQALASGTQTERVPSAPTCQFIFRESRTAETAQGPEAAASLQSASPWATPNEPPISSTMQEATMRESVGTWVQASTGTSWVSGGNRATFKGSGVMFEAQMDDELSVRVAQQSRRLAADDRDESRWQHHGEWFEGFGKGSTASFSTQAPTCPQQSTSFGSEDRWKDSRSFGHLVWGGSMYELNFGHAEKPYPQEVPRGAGADNDEDRFKDSNDMAPIFRPIRADMKMAAGRRESWNGQAEDTCVITTLMLQNVPRHLLREDLIDALVVQGYGGMFDYVYLPRAVHHSINKGFAFVNFVNADVADSFRRAHDTTYMLGDAASIIGRRPIQIRAADVQGLENNLRMVFGKKSERIRDSNCKPWVQQCSRY